MQFTAVGGLLDRDVDALACAVVAEIGEGGQTVGGSGVQGDEDMRAGGAKVVGRSAFDLGDPQREPIRGREGLDIAAASVRFPGILQIDALAFDAGRLVAAPVGGEDLAVQDHVCQSDCFGAFQHLA
jgi:hypothetical protein